MSGREEKRREEEYTYTYIRIRREIYIPSNYTQTFNELQKILKRESRSFSEWIRDNAVNYVRLHGAGNPQQDLKRILETGKPYRAPLVCACGVKATRKVTLANGEVVFCCGVHMPRDVKFWKTLK